MDVRWENDHRVDKLCFAMSHQWSCHLRHICRANLNVFEEMRVNSKYSKDLI